MINLSKTFISIGILLAVAVFSVLTVFQIQVFGIRTILGFLELLILPGFLTVNILNVRVEERWGTLALMVGTSLLELIGVGLLVNFVLPLFGLMHPLTIYPLTGAFCILTVFLVFLFWKGGRSPHVIAPYHLSFESIKDLFVVLIAIGFIGVSVIGTMRLNNGQNSSFTVLMLIGIACLCSFLVFEIEKGKKNFLDNIVPLVLFCLSLSLLFMTSLRGWYITGHDIQREYAVFEITKNAGFWNIDLYHDAYNACMSITILPTIFSSLLKLADPYVYKVLFQLIFALVPPLLYVYLKRYFSASVAFLSVLYFMSFPAFFNDMPMLNRQELAFFFFALMMYIVFDVTLSLMVRRLLFVFFGLGLILSHYSTTYTVLCLLIFLLVARPLFHHIAPFLSKKRFLNSSGFALLHTTKAKTEKNITSLMVLFLIVVTFTWTSAITHTSSDSLTRVITSTLHTLQSSPNTDNRSNDTSYSLFSFGEQDPRTRFTEYQKEVVTPKRVFASPDMYYESNTFSMSSSRVISNDITHLTRLGTSLSRVGINVPSFNYNFRQISGKIVQILLLLGFFAVILNRKYSNQLIPIEYSLLCIGSIIFVASIVVLPILSIEYGLLRAFQQSLLLLSPFIVLGSIALLPRASNVLKLAFATSIVLIFFLSNTGVFTYILGGYGGQLTLNNAGKYYDNYYLHESEIASINWLSTELQKGSSANQPELQADPFGLGKINALTNLHGLNDINPALVQKNAYVYLSYTNVHKNQVSISYKGDSILYTYPKDFLSKNKNLVYSNGDVEVFK